MIRPATRTVMLFVLAFASGASADQVITQEADESLTGMSEARLQRIAPIIEGYVDRNQIPGAVYAIARNGHVAHLNSIGAMQEDTIFRFYSMTKPITTVAVLMLYEEGKFLLTDPVSRYLPEFSNMMIYNGPGDVTPAHRQITIEDLLTHTAGLSYGDDTVDGVPKLYVEAKIWEAKTLAEFSEQVAALPLVSEPGSRWHYSVAHDILGRLVEVVAEQAFDEFLSERILVPLQMTDTSFYILDEKLHRFTPLFSKDGDKMSLAESVEDSAYRNKVVFPSGGSGLLSTVGDYLRFTQMLVQNGRSGETRYLSRKTVDLMMSDHLPTDMSRPRMNDSWLGETENRSGDMHLGLGQGYGGYVIVDVAENDVPGSAGTYSWGGGASTYFFIDREEQLIGIFLTQLTPSNSYPLRAQFRGLVYQGIDD